MKVALQGNRMAIHFPFDLLTIEIVRAIPDRAWNLKSHPGVWSVPASPWHCAEVIKTLKPRGFQIDPQVVKCADAKVEKPNLRKKLPKELYNYQKDGVEFIYAARGRAIVGDDMGLGKSAEALVWSQLFGGEKVLIVAPANVIWKWALKEFKMWAGEATWQVIENGKQPIEDRQITIMSYAIMTDRYEELLMIPFDTMIFDEAHYLKTAGKKKGSMRGRAAKKIIKGVPHVLFLTGTVFKNRRIEMYPLLNMLDPKAWSSVIEFGTRYCGGVFSQGHWIVQPDKETNTEELQARIAPILLRRTKNQVAIDLPDLTRVSIPITIDNSKEYEQTLRSVKEQARKEGYKPARALTLLNKLRQVVGMGKVAAAVELAEDILETGNQVVLFAHHREVVTQLKMRLSQTTGRVPRIIDGSTPAKERQALADAFVAGQFSTLIISSAGREGIDLYSASNVIFVERLWTPADEEQIEARLHRNGQKNAVMAHYLVGRDTVDDRLDEIVRRKRAEFSNLIETDIVKEVFMDLI